MRGCALPWRAQVSTTTSTMQEEAPPTTSAPDASIAPLSIEPPPTIVELSESEPIPDDVARDMLRRGMKYTAERE